MVDTVILVLEETDYILFISEEYRKCGRQTRNGIPN